MTHKFTLTLGIALSLFLLSAPALAGDKADKRARREERRKKKEAEKARREAERKKKEAEEAESGKPAGDGKAAPAGDKPEAVKDGEDKKGADRPDYRENEVAHVVTGAGRDLVWIKLTSMQRAALTRKRKVGRKLVQRGQRDEAKQSEALAPIQLTATQLKAISHATRIKRSWPRKVLLHVHLESLRKKPGDKHAFYVARPVDQFKLRNPGDATPKQG